MGKSGQYDVTVHSSFGVTTKTKERKKMFCWIAVTFDCHILISASLSPSELCAQFIETSSNGYRLLGNAGE